MDIAIVCSNPLAPTTANTLLSVVQALFAATCTLDPSDSYQDDYSPSLKTGDVFDFIVIGAGAAGSVVANRLSENPDWNVLLGESGGLPTADTEVPTFSEELRYTRMVREYRTEPTRYSCRGFTEGRCPLPCGNVLGGSSSIGSMVYVRGSDEDYNFWESKGNRGWNWTTVLKYFIKSENLSTADYGIAGLHGLNGYLTTTYVTSAAKFPKILLEAAAETGYKIVKDETPNGFFGSLSTMEDGKRCSTSKAFLSKIKTRSNLLVAMNALVTKILLEEGRAVGVKINLHGRSIEVSASKEVVVSAGAIGSPKLLMLSGIGPKEHLESLGIDVVRNLPVGKHLQDHARMLGLLAKINPNIGDNITTLDNLKARYEYLMENKGPLAGVGARYIKWMFNTNNHYYPNIQVTFNHFSIQEERLQQRFNGTNSVTYNSITEANQKFEVIGISVALLTPKSRGKVELQSTNPNDDPLIYANHLRSVKDVEVLLKAIDKVKQFLETPIMQKYHAKLFHLEIPECEEFVFDTRKYWTCNMRNLVLGNYHPVGTCKMGRHGVVGDRLKVHGISALRVIDASIMPKIVRANTLAPVVMIGEKGADLIKEDWGFPID